MKLKILYTTSEYLDALKCEKDGNLYECSGKDFVFFGDRSFAEQDAQWIYDFKKEKSS